MIHDSKSMLRAGVTAAFFLSLVSAVSCSRPEENIEVIRSVKAEKGNLVVKVESTASVKPYNRVEIKPPIAGRVDDVTVKEGDMVKQGQILAWMSSTERAALLDAARSQSPEVLERWNAAYKPAPLISPLDGMVIVRAVEPGQTVLTSEPVVVISDRLMVQALVDETDLSQIHAGQKTEIRLDAYRSKLISGKVDHISYESTLVNNVNMYAVDILPDEAHPFFRSGMTASVVFVVSDLKDVILLPSEAVAQWPKNMPKPPGADFAVYKKAFGKKPVPSPVKIGESDGRMTEISEGLNEGESVLVVRFVQKTSSGAFSPMGARRTQPRNKS